MAKASSTNDESSWILPAIVVVISIIYNLCFALLCSYLPHDPLYVGVSISVYAWAGCVLGVIGLVGVATKWPTLISAFARFLLLDTAVSALCRLVALDLLVEQYRSHDICSNLLIAPWHGARLGHDIVTSAHWQQSKRRGCKIALDATQVVLIVLLVALTVAQGVLAVAMRRYAKDLEQEDWQNDADVLVEESREVYVIDFKAAA